MQDMEGIKVNTAISEERPRPEAAAETPAEEVAKLRMENEDLRCRCRNMENDNTFLRGRISALEFAIRCNGVSGADVMN